MFIGLPALGLVLLLYVLQSLRIAVGVEQAARVNVGTDAVFHLRVRNRLPWAAQAHIRVAGRPAGWPAATSYPSLHLDGREELPVPLVVRVPVSASPGETATVQVRVRPNKWSPWLVSRRFAIETIDVVVERPMAASAPAAATAAPVS